MSAVLIYRMLGVVTYAVIAAIWLIGMDRLTDPHLTPGAGELLGARLGSIVGFIVVSTGLLSFIVWRQTRAALRADQQTDLFLNEVPSGLAIIDSRGMVQYANAAFRRLLCVDPAEMTTHTFEFLINRHLAPAAPDRSMSAISRPRAMLPPKGVISRTLSVQDRTATRSDVIVRVTRLDESAGEPAWIATVLDVTEIQRISAAHATNAAALDVVSDGVVIVDLAEADQAIVYSNAAFHHNTGFTAAEVIGRNCRMLQGHDRDQPEIVAIREAIVNRKPVSVTLRNYRKTGEMFWSELRLAPVLNSSGEATHYVGAMRDVTRVRKMTFELEQLAKRDPLTLVPNRTGFRGLLKQHLKDAEADEFAVIKLNVVGFHGINTTFGYETGDALLVQIAARLKHLSAVTLGRVDADNFVVAAPITSGQSEDEMIAALGAELLPSFVLPGVTLRVFFHVGYTVGPASLGVGRLMRQAAAALHEGRAARARLPRRYTADSDREISRRIRLTGDLQQAVADGDLIVHYQPKVDLADGRIAGAEGLVRWQHPTFGLQLPSRFIPTAEQTGLIVPIGEWAMRAIARYAVSVNGGRVDHYRFAINVSQMQFRQIDLPALAERILEETQADPSWIILELTESVFADETAITRDTLRRLRDMGLGLSIDDFGTEYSSLRYLGAFPITEIKIDRTFVRDMAGNRAKRAVVDAVVRIGAAVNVDVVAEGIETAAEWRLLRELGCRYGQGFYFSPPVEASEFTWFADNQPNLPAGGAIPLALHSQLEQ